MPRHEIVAAARCASMVFRASDCCGSPRKLETSAAAALAASFMSKTMRWSAACELPRRAASRPPMLGPLRGAEGADAKVAGGLLLPERRRSHRIGSSVPWAIAGASGASTSIDWRDARRGGDEGDLAAKRPPKTDAAAARRHDDVALQEGCRFVHRADCAGRGSGGARRAPRRAATRASASESTCSDPRTSTPASRRPSRRPSRRRRPMRHAGGQAPRS